MCTPSAKAILRSEMKTVLSKLSKENIEHQSRYITNKLIGMPEFLQSTRIGLYLSMPEEVQTDELVKKVLDSGKECFIPRYNSTTMEMVKLNSIEDFNKIPKNKWNIRQPKLNEKREDAYLNGGLELVIAPGLAFTTCGKRLGRGKGYYDRFLNEMKLFRESNSNGTFTIGLAFTEQILEDLPTIDTDFVLDHVLYKSK